MTAVEHATKTIGSERQFCRSSASREPSSATTTMHTNATPSHRATNHCSSGVVFVSTPQRRIGSPITSAAADPNQTAGRDLAAVLACIRR